MNSCAECMIWKVSSCVRSGNPDLDFEMWISDFAIESEIWKRISVLRNLSSGWISIKKSKCGFHGFLFYLSVGKSEKGFAKLFSFLLLIMRARARPLFLRTVFQILFRISQSNGKKEIQNQISQRWNPFSDFAFDCKSEIWISNSKSNAPFIKFSWVRTWYNDKIPPQRSRWLGLVYELLICYLAGNNHSIAINVVSNTKKSLSEYI